MTGLIGALRVTLGADTASFEKGMKRARTEMSAMQKASTALKTAFAGMVGLLAFDQFASLAKAGLDYASSLGEVAAQLGVSTDRKSVGEGKSVSVRVVLGGHGIMKKTK